MWKSMIDSPGSIKELVLIARCCICGCPPMTLRLLQMLPFNWHHQCRKDNCTSHPRFKFSERVSVERIGQSKNGEGIVLTERLETTMQTTQIFYCTQPNPLYFNEEIPLQSVLRMGCEDLWRNPALSHHKQVKANSVQGHADLHRTAES
jgi:hypothetical protein